MATLEDLESSGANAREPLMQHKRCEESCTGSQGSISMVLLSTAVAVCGSFEFGSCVGYSAPTQSEIINDIGLSLSEYSIFGSILTIGAMIGAVTSGRVADYIGRKKAMGVSALICIAGWFAIYFAKDATMLYIGRVLSGYGIGVLSYVVPIFIAEISPKNLRGGLTTLNQLLICGGDSVAFIVGTFVTWRSLVLVGLIPCILLLVGLFFIPESPRWLAKVGNQKEFQAALQSLRGKHADISEEATEIQEYTETLHSLPKARIQDLFQRRYINAVIVGVGLMVFQQIGGINGVGFYASEIFISAGFSSGNLGTILMASIQVPITVLGAILMDKCGRRPLLMVSASGTFIGTLLTATSFYLKGQGLCAEWIPTLALSGILVYIAAFSIGMGAVPWVIMSEIFSIDIKAIGGSLVTLVNWSGSFAISYAFNFLMSWSSSGTFFIFSAANALTVLFVARVVPETKGRTLEEIQASLNSCKYTLFDPLAISREEPSKREEAVAMEVDEGGGGGETARPLMERREPSLFDSSMLVVVASTAVAVAGSFEFGISVGYSSPSQSGIMRDLDLSLAEYSFFGSILTIGAMIGAIVSGPIADRIGRRCAMAISDLLCSVGWLSILLSKDSWWLDLGRLSTGCGIGLLSYVVPVYISEITPKNLRGGFATVNQLMICCGGSLAYVLGTILSWRALAIIGVAPCLLQLVGLLLIPESPRWLAKSGHDHEFEATLQRLRGKDSDILEEAEEIKEFTKNLLHLPQASVLELFQKKYLHSVIVGVGLMVLQQFGGVNAICFYASEIFVSAGFSSGNSGMIAMVAVQIPMTTLGVLLMDKAGRRPLLMVSAAGTCLGCFLVGMSFLSKEVEWLKQLNTVLALAGILVYTGSFSLGMGGIPWVIMSEIFPMNVKGPAGSLVTLVSWLGSWIVSYAFNFLMLWSSEGTFFMFACICGLTIVFVERLVPETKGRTLEEIQASMNSFTSEKS
ncbi:uncharacterized protein [Typha angustifolia]|uniref:uncharacterized protein n=1 Tax=Typha angustifolia TaxID=59011 RepID=UPI003C2CD96D